MGVIENRVLGGFGQAAQNVVMGDLGGAVTAVTSPEEMSPREKDVLLKRLGVDKGPFAPAFRLLTNPALILSAAVSMKFPVATARNMFKFSEELSGYTSRFPVTRGLASIHSWFRGTPIPELYTSVGEKRMSFISEMGGKLADHLRSFEQSTGAFPTSREQKLVGAWLDGLHKRAPGLAEEALAPALEAYMTRPVLDLAKKTRGVLDDAWAKTFGTIEQRKRIVEAVARNRKAGFADEFMDTLGSWAESGKPLPDYFPRRLIRTEDEFMRFLSAVTGTGRSAGKIQDFAKRAVDRTRRLVGPESYKREGHMMPSLRELDEIKEVLDPAVYEKMKDKSRGIILKRVTETIGSSVAERMKGLTYEELTGGEVQKMLDPDDLHMFGFILKSQGPKEYSLKAFPSINKYIHTMGTTHGWTASGHGEAIYKEVNVMRTLADDARAKRRLEMLENTYIPMALGWGDFNQALKSQAWQQSMMRLADTLDTPAIKGVLGAPLHARMTDMMKADRSTLSLVNLQRKAASYFYLSTLGGNVGSSLKNVLQLVLTTGPVLGFRTAGEGVLRAMKKSEGYFTARFGEKLGHDAALRKAFPEFAEAGLAGSPLTDEALQNTLQNAYELGARMPGKISGKALELGGKVSKGLMALFSASEHGVRLSTFEAGMLHAERTGLTGSDALKFARKVTETTQFLTGPANTPYSLLKTGPLTKQLTQFPLRMLEFATESSFALGSKDKTLMFGMNPGTFARAIAGSTIAYELGNSAGLDMKDSLISAAIPGPSEPGKPFAPIPLIPPVFQILGALASDIGTGDIDQLRQIVPLLVPGGVGLSRAVGMIPGGRAASQFMGRQYADYQAPSPTGRIGVYTSEGQLKGFFSPWDVFAQAVGVKTAGPQAEQELLRMVVANRDGMREEKKSYIDAVAQNSPGKAEGIAQAFKTRYGFGIPVTPKDIENAQIRRSIPRLANVIQTLPPGPLRQQYIDLIAATMGATGEGTLGMNPGDMAKPGATRAAAQSRVQGTGTKTQFSVFGGVEPSALSHRKFDESSLSPF